MMESESMRGKEIVEEMMKEYSNRPILVYGDPDVDGLFSMLLVCQLLDGLNLKYKYHVNKDRQHGFLLSKEKLQGYFVIAVDFSIPKEVMKELVENDIAIICIDHHTILDEELVYVESKGAKGVVINNQYKFEPEEDTYLSGAGVVYELYKDIYSWYDSKEREVLVGITLLSDARPIENRKARKYLTTTYNADTQKGYSAYLLKSTLGVDFGFGVPKLDRNFIDFKFSPEINALLRFGKEREAISFILGEGLKDLGLREIQSALKLEMEHNSDILELDNLLIVGVDVEKFRGFRGINISSFIGLLCSNLRNSGKSVLGFCYKGVEIERCSFRGKYDNVDYLSKFLELGIEAKGHPTAFGITEFQPNKMLLERINECIGKIEQAHIQTTKVYEVSNLSVFLLQKGLDIARENLYVRDMYRTYIKYKGNNIQEKTRKYKIEELTLEDMERGVVPDIYEKQKNYRYIRDRKGNKKVSYIEYLIDGKLVKSFGVEIENGVILPILEKGYIQLYVRESIS